MNNSTSSANKKYLKNLLPINPMRANADIQDGMIVHKIKMHSVLFVDRVRPIVFQHATEFMRLQRWMERIGAKQRVFLMRQLLNTLFETTKLFFKTRSGINAADRTNHTMDYINSFKLVICRVFPSFHSRRAARDASSASAVSHCRRISFSNSLGSTTTSRRADPPRSKIFFGISIVIVGIFK